MGWQARRPVTAEMIDVVFEISGGTLPVAYPYELWGELSRLIPQLEENENVGVIPLRMAESKEGMLLPKRAKLVLRLPREMGEIVAGLAQKQLRVAGIEIQLGSCKTRPIQHYPTLHAKLVTGPADEITFVAEVEIRARRNGCRSETDLRQTSHTGRR